MNSLSDLYATREAVVKIRQFDLNVLTKKKKGTLFFPFFCFFLFTVSITFLFIYILCYSMHLLYTFSALLFFVNQIQTLPIGNDDTSQTIYAFHNQATESTNKHAIEAQYDVYQTIMDHYENVVDNSISSSSEHLLLNLIHRPREELNLALATQMELIGLNDIPGKI